MASRLEQLTQRRDQLNAQIQALKNREAHQARKQATRRKILVGAAVLDQVKRGEWPEDRLLAMLEGFLDKPLDRALFGLPPKPGEGKSGAGI
jgi:hypothetical protein